MKRVLILVMIIAVMASLAACAGADDTVYFYYTPSQISYGSDRDMIVGEARSSLSRDDDLSYLLSFYFQGPLDQELELPVPIGAQVLSIRRNGDTLTLVMSQEFSQLKDLDLTLACSCIAKTCFGLTDATYVSIITETENPLKFTVSRDGLTLTDETRPKESTN